MKKNQFLCLLFSLVLLLPMLCLASCSKAYEAEDSYRNEVVSEAPEVGMGNDKLASAVPPEEIAERKIIKTYEINAETKNFDATVADISALVAEHGGYVESNSVSNYRAYQSKNTRYASYTIRIPAEKADAFIGTIGNTLNVTRSSSYAKDVSESYYSMEATLKELETERDSLLAIMESLDNKEDYNFWLTLQTRISDVRQQIARYQAQLNNYDSLVEYSTINLSVNEVVDYTVAEEGFWPQLGAAFADCWSAFGSFIKNFVIALASALPFLVLITAIAVPAVILIRRAFAKKKAQKAAAKKETTEQTHEEQ